MAFSGKERAGVSSFSGLFWMLLALVPGAGLLQSPGSGVGDIPPRGEVTGKLEDGYFSPTPCPHLLDGTLEEGV